MLSFDVLLPRLITAHSRGLLIPFLGAGMSVGACPNWAEFVGALEGEAGIVGPSATDEAALKPPALIRRVNAVLRTLGRAGQGRFADAARRVLYGLGVAESTTDQTDALADIDWPLVLTTNYDDLFVRAYATRLRRDQPENARRFTPAEAVALRVVGRDTPGCLRVLQSLDATAPATLWALHGFLGRVDGDLARYGVHIDDPERRALEVVAGHEEYRRIAHASVQYRRAFAEVCRRRSLLFLGASLEDVYLMDMISEVQELHGFGAHPHYALVRAGDGHDLEFLRTRFNIVACEYADHANLPHLLHSLRDALCKPPALAASWAYDVTVGHASGSALRPARLTITSDPMTGDGPAEQKTLVSAGLLSHDVRPPDGPAYLSKSMIAIVDACTPGARTRDGSEIPGSALTLLGADTYLVGAVDTASRLAIAIPWSSSTRRDLRRVGPALEAALTWAASCGASALRTTVLGSGSGRHFATRFPLAAMIRSYGTWCRTAERPLDLTIHVVDRAAHFELTSGRMDVPTLLTAADVRFWTEVTTEARHEYAGSWDVEPMSCVSDTRICDVAIALGFRGISWQWRVEPSYEPAPADGGWLAAEEISCLVDSGVLDGSTVSFRAVP